MKKTLITSVTAFAIVLCAGMSMAGPLGGNGQRGFAKDVRSTVSQAFDQQSTNMNDRGLELSSKQDLGEMKLTSTQQTGAYGSSWSSELPNVVVIPVEGDGSYTWVIGKTDDDWSDLSFYLYSLKARIKNR
ncbi:hypothetical protein [Ruegeria atlantica]|uniref:hypothetical protein n=1 Tax=Ruegeria atlantica TaxID=81569 RepID=UPI00147B7E02|nr:hypothetical protein [Ruegeria atlantica]